ncbi:MAG: 30S ribosomal protein S12 methylthiotransferase RimO [Planctomycetota bacterium]|jgi:ribosomal protein S12 methylthiotransferase
MNSPDPCRVALVSLGCPKNLVDSEKIAGHLAEAGCVVGAPMVDADVIVVNTCGFLSSARDEALEVIGEALAHKQQGPARRVVVAGCLVNRDGEELLAEAAGIDAMVGIYDRPSIVGAVLGDEQLAEISSNDKPVAGDRGRLRLTLPHTAYLRISEGCSHRCTFCTIPDIRGPFRSKALNEIAAEARELVDSGAIELNLIGQDTTVYGSDVDDGPGLGDVLRGLDGVDGVQWLRLMYAYPTGLTDDLLAAMAECDHVVPYIDVPLQHISDPVLKRMGRRMGRADIEATLDRVRDRLGSPAIRTTFIVGFPGETDEMFEELLGFVEEFSFDAAGVFAYSPEEGTPAAKLDGAVAEEVKAERVERLMLAQQEIAFEANAASVGQSIDVLVDAADNGGPPVGRHAGQAPEIDSVCLLTEPAEPGRIILVDVVDWQDYDLIVQPSDRTL